MNTTTGLRARADDLDLDSVAARRPRPTTARVSEVARWDAINTASGFILCLVGVGFGGAFLTADFYDNILTTLAKPLGWIFLSASIGGMIALCMYTAVKASKRVVRAGAVAVALVVVATAPSLPWNGHGEVRWPLSTVVHRSFMTTAELVDAGMPTSRAQALTDDEFAQLLQGKTWRGPYSFIYEFDGAPVTEDNPLVVPADYNSESLWWVNVEHEDEPMLIHVMLHTSKNAS